MPDKIFLDTNTIIYCYSQDELDKQQSEDLQDGQQIEDKLTIINSFLPIFP